MATVATGALGTRPALREMGTTRGNDRGVRSQSREVVAMPAGSSKKRERQYEHIKDSYREQGVSKDEAEERAARTVNKQRREAGETKKK